MPLFVLHHFMIKVNFKVTHTFIMKIFSSGYLEVGQEPQSNSIVILKLYSCRFIFCSRHLSLGNIEFLVVKMSPDLYICSTVISFLSLFFEHLQRPSWANRLFPSNPNSMRYTPQEKTIANESITAFTYLIPQN